MSINLNLNIDNRNEKLEDIKGIINEKKFKISHFYFRVIKSLIYYCYFINNKYTNINIIYDKYYIRGYLKKSDYHNPRSNRLVLFRLSKKEIKYYKNGYFHLDNYDNNCFPPYDDYEDTKYTVGQIESNGNIKGDKSKIIFILKSLVEWINNQLYFLEQQKTKEKEYIESCLEL